MLSVLNVLLLAAAGSTLVSQSLAASASCMAGWDWANNTLGQNPCQIAGALEAGCQGYSEYDLPQLGAGSNYVAPQKNSSANICDCNTVMYSLYEACTACQNVTLLTWSFWEANCDKVYVAQYPNDIPKGVNVPHWAYLDVATGGTFDPVAAKAAGDSPEATPFTPSTAQLPSSTGPSSSSGTPSGSGTASSPSATNSSGDPSNSGSNTDTSTKKKSNAGAIAGGVVGGLAFLAIIAGLVFWFNRRKRTQNLHQAEYNDGGYSGPAGDGYSNDPRMSQAPMKIYDPSDPSTFPTQGHVPSLSTGPTTHTTEDASYTRPAVGRYNGAPEL